MDEFTQAYALLHQFKGDAYLHGPGALAQLDLHLARLSGKAVLIADRFPGSDAFLGMVYSAFDRCGIKVIEELRGAAPNAPREDLFRIAGRLEACQPDIIASFGGGSTIDSVKSAEVLRTLNGSIDDYFGTGMVSQALEKSGKKLHPHIAIQSAASSGAHLTKYSNITDVKTGQKKLVVDEAIVPARPVFDYSLTLNAPAGLTADGALDGISHALEVLYSAAGKPGYERVAAVAEQGIGLVVRYLPEVLDEPHSAQAREALGLATDLGGYAIMLGGTNGAHLTSFSLVDILSHGRACGLLNPYYTVFFAPAVQAPLRMVGNIYYQAGYLKTNPERLSGRDLGVAVAEAMIAFEERVGFPTRLADVPGFTPGHIERALEAARSPQLKMKLENMPVRMTAEMVDSYMGPILEAASSGDLSLIKNVA